MKMIVVDKLVLELILTRASQDCWYYEIPKYVMMALEKVTPESTFEDVEEIWDSLFR